MAGASSSDYYPPPPPDDGNFVALRAELLARSGAVVGHDLAAAAAESPGASVLELALPHWNSPGWRDARGQAAPISAIVRASREAQLVETLWAWATHELAASLTRDAFSALARQPLGEAVEGLSRARPSSAPALPAPMLPASTPRPPPTSCMSTALVVRDMYQAPPLPFGWEEVEHEQYGTFYLHTSTRVVGWTRPYATRENLGDIETHEPPVGAEPDADLLEAIEKFTAAEAQAAHASRLLKQRVEQKASAVAASKPARPEDQMREDLDRRPAIGYRRFVPPPKLKEAVSEIRSSAKPGVNLAHRLLGEYCRSVLGARIQVDTRPATDGAWAVPPLHCRVRVLGIVIGEGYHSQAALAMTIACEEAAMRICPRVYAKELETHKVRGRCVKPTLTHEADVAGVEIGDERVHSIDLCLSKSAPMMLQEYVARTMGQTTVRMECKQIKLPAGKCGGARDAFEYEIFAGAKRYREVDRTERSAKLRCSVAVLRDTHPEVRYWSEMMALYPYREVERLDAGSRQLACFPPLVNRSQTAAALYAGDKLTLISQGQKVRDAKLARRGVSTESSGASVVGPSEAGRDFAPDDDGGDGEATALRRVPGAGENFSVNWQRQFDLDTARQAALSSGLKGANDTKFALKFEHEREKIDASKLVGLRRAVLELEATELTDQMRANEPMSLSTTHGSQGLEQRYGAHEEVGKSHEWAPWQRGTRTHARLMEIAGTSSGPADADPSNRNEQGRIARARPKADEGAEPAGAPLALTNAADARPKRPAAEGGAPETEAAAKAARAL